MASHGQTGSRIRERRMDRKIRQADLAAAVEISPSYLNLIEHNRRRIAGKLLASIAVALETTPEQLARGADSGLLDQMRAAAAGMSQTVEIARAEELAGRYPGWSGLIAAQAHRLSALEERVQVMADRMTYDPELAGSLLEVISAVTAIRSAASILVGGETLDADWQGRFHRNIYDDSIRLAASSEALIRYLDAPEADSPAHFAPMDEVEAYLSAQGFHLSALEAGGDAAALVTEAGLRSAAAQSLLEAYFKTYLADVAAMPLTAFAAAAKAGGYDPVALAAQFGVDVAAVLRRFASLPAGANHPPMGLAVADASGALLLLKTVDGFAMQRTGAGCPLWPIYAAFARQGQPLRVEATMPGTNGQRFLCYAVATQAGAARFDAPQVLRATMLVMSDPPEGASQKVEVGVACRICPRVDCAARREPSAIM
ncbi:MAG: short-chain fatty acyl-CoA regulator family protein [Yoonia sp.]|nr:short-chain fatty acyl-CoA regulator family protein [Yoonia sp.]